MIIVCGLFGWASGSIDLPIDKSIIMSRLTDEDILQMAQAYEELMTAEDLSVFGMDIDPDLFTDASTKNSTDLVIYAEQAYRNGWGYTSGTFGRVLTEDALDLLIKMYPSKVGDYEGIIRRKWLGRRTADCMGLIKGYCWYDPETGGFDYQSNGLLDYDIRSFYHAAEVKGTMDTMPDVPGLAVWWDGHMGVYVGDGYVIHAYDYDSGVIKERLEEEPWTNWMQIPCVRYE